MDVNVSFDSDSTYCSLFENINGKKKPEPKLSDLKFLDKVHKEVILHFEGKVLLGRLEVVQYIKRIRKMKFKSARNQYFAEKITSSLSKIYKLTKLFEKSLSISNMSQQLDPIEDCSLSENFKAIKIDNNDPKQILLQSTSVNDESNSFPLEMLTNNNFLTSSSQNVDLSMNNSSVYEIQSLSEPRSSKIISRTVDLPLSENTESFLINSHVNTMQDIFNTEIEPVHSTEKHTEFKINEEQNLQNCTTSQDSDETLKSQYDIKEKNITEHIVNDIHPEDGNTLLQISKICVNLLVKQTSNETEKINTENNNDMNVKSVTVKNVLDIRNLYDESYNIKMNQIRYSIANNNKKWQEIKLDLDSMDNLTKNVHNDLEKLLEKLHMEELETAESQRIKKLKEFHNFKKEDCEQLNVEELINSNMDRLEEISEEFKKYLKQKNVDEDDF